MTDKDDAARRDADWHRRGIPSLLRCDNGAPFSAASASPMETPLSLGLQVDVDQHDLVLVQEGGGSDAEGADGGTGYPSERNWITCIIHESSRLVLGTHVWCVPPTKEALERLLDDYAGA